MTNNSTVIDNSLPMTPTDTQLPHEIDQILNDNRRRNNAINATFNPVTGEGSVGDRTKIFISDFVIPTQWLPSEMMSIPFVKKLAKAGSIDAFLSNVLNVVPNDDDHNKVSEKLIRLRYRFDFPFWAATLVWIHNKEAGSDVLFRLRFPQRILVARFEEKRKANLPIRLILLKARQWGGSTTTDRKSVV